MKKLMVTVVLATLLPCCLYANVQMPLSYRSPTPADVGGASALGAEAHGEACNTMVLGAVAWGDGGYAAAVSNAKEASGATMLADVKADSRLFNVLGVYQKACTVVTGRVVK
jgi:hypothetical protein